MYGAPVGTRHATCVSDTSAPAAEANRHIGTAAIAPARVQHASIVGRDADGKLIRLAGLPQPLARRRVIGIELQAGVHDQLIALRTRDDERRAVGTHVPAPIGFPLFLTRTFIQRQQIRGRDMVAEQDQEILVERRRARMSPHQLKGRILLPQMALPHELAVHIEGDELPRSEQGVDQAAVRDGAGAGQVGLPVDCRQLLVGLQSILPELTSVRSMKRRDDEVHPASVSVDRSARGRITERSLQRRVRSGSADQRRMRAWAQHPSADLIGEHDPVAPDDRRRDAKASQGRLPDDVVFAAPARREPFLLGDAGPLGTSPLRPVVGIGGAGEREGTNKKRYDTSHEPPRRTLFSSPRCVSYV